MLYISVEDFYRQTGESQRLTREEETDCVQRMAQGDTDAREQLIRHHLRLAAALLRKAAPQVQTLHTVYRLVATVEKCVDTFDFARNREPFLHRLSWALRQCLTSCLAQCR